MITTPKAKLLCLAVCLVWALPLCAEQPPRAEILTAYRIGTTPPMANYNATHHPAPNAPFSVFPLRKPGSHPGGGGGGGGSSWRDTVLQTSPVSPINYATNPNGGFAGLGSVGYVPPDTNISVSDTQIVETVNVDYAVYDKTGGVLQAAAPIHNIFAAAAKTNSGSITTSDMCASVDGGDPIVLFDRIDNRWIISQLAYNKNLSDNHFCIAISTSADARRSYDAYDVPFGGNLPDYPKLGIWASGSWGSLDTATSGVYFSANMFSGGNTFTGAIMCGFPLSYVTKGQSTFSWPCVQNGTSVFSVLPADIEGSPGLTVTTLPAPAGTNEYFLQFSGSNTLNLYQFNPDFGGGSPAVSGPTNITVATFREACGGGACVPQSGAGTKLDSLGDRLMYRLSYRNFGGTTGQSMVVTHSVQDSPSSSQTGVRWYQLTNTGSTWGVSQKTTFGSFDSNYRWMGSIAQDKVGDLGLGYSVSSSSAFPYLAVTGKTPGESGMELETPLNSMANGAQRSVNRWGDYSSMSVDPSDDCTMWYANEYLKSTGSYTNWGTWITSLKFNGCN